MLIQEIKTLINNQQLASLELSDYDATEITGVFLSVTEKLIVMQMIGNDGSSDGFTVFEPDLITELYWGNREHRCIQSMAREKTQITPILLKSVTFQDAIIELSSRYHSIALFSVTEGDNFEVAQVVEHDDEWLKLRCSGTLKTLSSMTKLVQIDSICRVEFGSDYLSDLAQLHEHEPEQS